MNSDLDMNSHRVLNLPMPVYPSDPVRLSDVKELSGAVYTDAQFAARFRPSRNEFLKDLPKTFWRAGDVVTAGPVSYQYDGISTSIPDMPG